MSERIELIQTYSQLRSEIDRLTAQLDFVKTQLKEFGTFSEGGFDVVVSVVSRETIALGDIKKLRPDVYEGLKSLGFVNQSESERLSVKLKEDKNEIKR